MIKAGDKYYIQIIDEGKRGGIAKVLINKDDDKKFVIIIPEAKKDKRYEIEITTVKPNYAYGKIIKELKKEEILDE